MKKIHYIPVLISFGIAITLSGCFDLDKYPEGMLSSANALSSSSEMQKSVLRKRRENPSRRTGCWRNRFRRYVQ